MSDSILNDTKKVLGLDESYTAFDPDITLHINSVFSTLEQLGIGPEGGYAIASSNDSWDEFLGTDKRLNAVKTYIYLRVRLLFDPPSTGFVLTSMEKQIQELEWRLNVTRELTVHPFPLEEV